MSDIPVAKIANLSALTLSPEELEGIQSRLEETLSYIDNLKEVDVTKTPPTSSVTGSVNVFFEDGSAQERTLQPGSYKVDRII